MGNPPRVSVLMAVRNEEERLPAVVGAVLNQTWADHELVIVDDGSTDGTPEYLRSLKDSRVRVVRKTPSGLTDSLIQGLCRCDGEFVARLDADDLPAPDRLEKQVRFLEAKSDVALVGSGVAVVDAGGRSIREFLYPPDHDGLCAELMRLINPIPHSTMMFRRAAIDRCGGYRSAFRKAQDYDLILRLVERYRIASIPALLCRIRCTEGSLTSDLREGEQLEFAGLALASALVRRGTGSDPLDHPGREEFMVRFCAWYRSSGYPRKFRSRLLRRKARISFERGRFLVGMGLLLAGSLGDPGYLAFRIGLGTGRGVSRPIVRWAEAQVHRSG